MKILKEKLPEAVTYRKKYVYTRKDCLELQRGQVSEGKKEEEMY